MASVDEVATRAVKAVKRVVDLPEHRRCCELINGAGELRSREHGRLREDGARVALRKRTGDLRAAGHRHRPDRGCSNEGESARATTTFVRGNIDLGKLFGGD